MGEYGYDYGEDDDDDDEEEDQVGECPVCGGDIDPDAFSISGDDSQCLSCSAKEMGWDPD